MAKLWAPFDGTGEVQALGALIFPIPVLALLAELRLHRGPDFHGDCIAVLRVHVVKQGLGAAKPVAELWAPFDRAEQVQTIGALFFPPCVFAQAAAATRRAYFFPRPVLALLADALLHRSLRHVRRGGWLDFHGDCSHGDFR